MNKRLQESVEEHEDDENECQVILDECDDMLLDSDYDFAADTIQGIRDHIEKHKTVTPRQKKAIANIRASVEERE